MKSTIRFTYLILLFLGSMNVLNAGVKGVDKTLPIKGHFLHNAKALKIYENHARSLGAKNPKQYARNMLKKVNLLERVLPKPREASKDYTFDWDKYRNNFLDPNRIKKGKEYLIKYSHIFNIVEKKYKVKKEIIAAIIGVETYFGRYMGRYSAIDTLTTLAIYHKRRSSFFTGELKSLLKLSKNVDIFNIKGSFAGALGIAQFIPSSMIHYAVDYDNDKTNGIWNSHPDAIASVANYLKEHKYNNNKYHLFKCRTVGTRYKKYQNKAYKPKYSLSTLRKNGIFPVYNSIPKKGIYYPIIVGDKDETCYIATSNFYTITRYNRSIYYALSVIMLAHRLAT